MKFRFSWMAMAVAALLTACSQDEAMDNISNEENSVLRVLVQDAGFNPIDLETRAVDNGATTTFEEGDAMGMFVMEKVDDTTSKVIVRNMKLTYNGSAWTSASPLYFYKNSDYVAYFPYDENLSVTATTTDALQTAIYDAFKSKLNTQTTVADYQAADLMMAKATITAGENNVQSLSFALTHRFSMVEVNIPVHNFSYTDINNATKTFQVQMQNQSLSLNEAAFAPVHFGNGKYRKLLEAGTAISSFGGEFNDPEDNRPVEFKSTTAVTLAAGNYKSYTVKVKDGLTYKDYSTTQSLGSLVGAYYCQDGSVYPSTFDENCIPDNVIGLIYAKVGDTDFAEKKYTYYVLSLNGRSNARLLYDKESFTDDEQAAIKANIDGLGNVAFEDNSNEDNKYPFVTDMNGFAWTNVIAALTSPQSYALTTNLNTNWNNNNTWKPQGECSKWFIPSAGQFQLLTSTFGGNFTAGKDNKKVVYTSTSTDAYDKFMEILKKAAEKQSVGANDYSLTQSLMWTTTQLAKTGNDESGYTSQMVFMQVGYTASSQVKLQYEAMDKTQTKRYLRPILAF